MNSDPDRRGNEKVRAFVAAGIGNVIEWYDFVIFGTLAPFFSQSFFPSDNRFASILSTFAVFAVAFFLRPIGGVFFGVLGDRIGRRGALALVVGLTSGATFFIGLLPSYAVIGWFAPLLLVLARCIQGFGAGGEMSGAAAFLLETAPREKKGLYAASVGATALLGVAVGILFTTILSALSSDAFMREWGWRIGFLLAGPIGLVAIYIRMKLHETEDFVKLRRSDAIEHQPMRTLVKDYRRSILASSAFTLGHAAGVYFLIGYMLSYLIVGLKIPRTDALLSNLIAVALVVVIALLTGAMSDRIGRRSLAIAAFVIYLIMIYPAFVLVSLATFTTVLLGQLLLAVPAGMTSGLVTILQVELFPAKVRYTGAGTSYNIGQLLGGAFTPYIATWLLVTYSRSIPFGYLAIVIVVSLVLTLYLLRETRDFADVVSPPR